MNVNQNLVLLRQLWRIQTFHFSKQWVASRNNDAYVREARKLKVRARSYFKLKEIDAKYKLIKAHYR